MTTRMFWKDATPRASATVNGHRYDGDPNQFADVPDADVAGMVGAGGWVAGPLVGTTAQRPAPTAGVLYIDLSLAAFPGIPGTGRVIIADGTFWKDPVTGALS